MSLANNIISFIDALGVIQGVFFGVMLTLLHSRESKPTFFLGAFIILFSLEPIPNILNDMGVLLQYPQWELFPVEFHFMAYPLFYIYIRRISILNTNVKYYKLLFPGLLEVLIAIIIFCLPSSMKVWIKESPIATLYFFTGVCYTIYVSYLILKLILRHTNEVTWQYTLIQNKTLNLSLIHI